MADVFLQDEMRIKGPQQDAKITERIAQDLAIKAAIAIERERQAEVQARQEALEREAQAREQAEAQAVEILRSAKPLYIERDDLARVAIEADAAVARKDAEIKTVLQLAYQPLRPVEATVEPSARPGWFESLRLRADLSAKHIFSPRGLPLSTEALRVGVTCVMGITSSAIGPGWIQVGRDVINFEI